jgi:hypothetical protein
MMILEKMEVAFFFAFAPYNVDLIINTTPRVAPINMNISLIPLTHLSGHYEQT